MPFIKIAPWWDGKKRIFETTRGFIEFKNLDKNMEIHTRIRTIYKFVKKYNKVVDC